jgi:trimeric autotransporter adhesin
LLFLRRTRGLLAIAIFATTTLFLAGCGSGGSLTVNNGDPNLRYTPPGTYQYQVTASSTAGVQLSQTVTLNLTVTAQ